ncbi:hypothetical protein ABE021_04090 [Sporosarcina gallistercoris]
MDVLTARLKFAVRNDAIRLQQDESKSGPERAISNTNELPYKKDDGLG